MKITIEPTENQELLPADCRHPKVMVEMEGDDQNFWDMVDAFKSLMYGLGFSHDLVKTINPE